MVQITRIYTRSGDKGRTSLGDSTRRKKSDIRFEAIGTIDELNAHCGLIAADVSSSLQQLIKRIQNDLFDLGADLAIPNGEALRVDIKQVEFLEKKIDEFNANLSPLNSFVLPGGSKNSALMHVARTVARRAERSMVLLNESEPINGYALQYINRLSDLLFVLCRHLNDNGKKDVLWVPGANR